ncbi:MAG: hypothetical protein JW760_02635 [Spirochaetales bacterium]|nr:hypothetical protein [Spirochaetales bacterium]
MKGFTGKELTVFFSIVGALLVLSLTVTLSISLAKRRQSTKEQELMAAEDETLLEFNDFLIPWEYQSLQHMPPRPLREPQEQWDASMTARFGIDVPSTILNIIKAENTKKLTEGF